MIEIAKAKAIMKGNLIGPEEIKKLSLFLNLKVPKNIPPLTYSQFELKKIAKDHILILGLGKDINNRKLTINYLRNMFGCDPNQKEPCFYNQDWYLKEKFASSTTLDNKWYLINKKVIAKTRGLDPDKIEKRLFPERRFPSAILASYTFFVYYLLNKKALWKHDFIWCNDKDHNGDRIYIGRYEDPDGINKRGFNIHRYLTIRSCYGSVNSIV